MPVAALRPGASAGRPGASPVQVKAACTCVAAMASGFGLNGKAGRCIRFMMHALTLLYTFRVLSLKALLPQVLSVVDGLLRGVRCSQLAVCQGGGFCPATTYQLGPLSGCVQCMAETDNPNKCIEQREDYFECLHHRKEVWHALRQAVASLYLLGTRDCEGLVDGRNCWRYTDTSLLQFTRLNAIYAERKRQLKAGIDVLKDDQVTTKPAEAGKSH